MPEPGARLSPRARQVLSWLLAPLLAMVAIGVQIGLDVPRAEMEPREPKKKPRKSAATRTTPENKPKPKPKRETWTPRSPEELEALRAEWSDAPFEDEPADLMFRRRHETALRSVATRARTTLLEGEKLVPLQIRPQCRTIRCTLELCGPEELLEDVAAVLPGVTVVDQPLWHAIREIDPAHAEPTQQARRGHRCRRWLVDFAVQGPKTTDFVIPIPTPDHAKD